MHRQQALSYTLVIAGVLLAGITAGLRMFETLGDKPAAASQKNRRGPQVAAFYEACIVHVAAPRIKAPSVQQAFVTATPRRRSGASSHRTIRS